MDTSTLTDLYQATGPFATALVDVAHDSENGAHEHELRVRAACEALREQGADDEVVAAVAARLGEVVHEPAPVARVVVATGDGVVYDQTASFRVDDTVATWAPLPDLARWIEHRDAVQTFVLATVDHEGGDVGLYRSDLPSPEQLESIQGSTENIHQAGATDWGNLNYQHRTENVWARNAAEVADRISSYVRTGTRLVLLAGDPRSKSLVRERLNEAEAVVVELEHGTRNEDGGDEALQQAVREALLDRVVRQRLERVHELRERLGRGDGAVAGVDDVADAFVQGRVETLLLDPALAAEAELDVSAHPGLALPEDRLPADQALVAAAVLTSAEVGVAPAAALAGEPVAAVLRWEG